MPVRIARKKKKILAASFIAATGLSGGDLANLPAPTTPNVTEYRPLPPKPVNDATTHVIKSLPPENKR